MRTDDADGRRAAGRCRLRQWTPTKSSRTWTGCWIESNRAQKASTVPHPEIEVVLDCFWGSVGMGGGPWIPPSAMRRLGALDLPLLVSFYYEEEPEPVEADSGSTD